jgi:4-aminobutyrate aminotransferase-like enzyme
VQGSFRGAENLGMVVSDGFIRNSRHISRRAKLFELMEQMRTAQSVRGKGLSVFIDLHLLKDISMDIKFLKEIGWRCV